MLNDAHCHFFSSPFFAGLARQRGSQTGSSSNDLAQASDALCRELQWEAPGSAETLADRWIVELDAHGVSRAALIASAPGDEQSVSLAVARHPERLIGFFRLDASAPDAVTRVRRGVGELGLRGVCLFPAMHRVSLEDERTQQIVRTAAEHPGTAVFVHCGVLTVGVRRKLGLPSRLDLRLGNPLAIARLAMEFPHVPFIIPHFGAGLLRETLMAADVCPNIHVDTSSSNSWMRYTPGLTLDVVLRTTLGVIGPSRLLFGTDSSFFPRGWQRAVHDEQRRAVEGLGLSGSDEALIFGGNLDRLFPPRTP
jgi:predicted TIM-barrel fold metal-dependent hydrolase